MGAALVSTGAVNAGRGSSGGGSSRSQAAGQEGSAGSSHKCLLPFNYAGRLPPVGSRLVQFLCLPPAQYFRYNLPQGDAAGAVQWSVDVHFAARSERHLVACFGAHLSRPGLTPVPINSHLSGGSVCQWSVKSRTEITCRVAQGVRSMVYPCQIALHPTAAAGRPQLVCYAGQYGLTLADLATGDRRHRGKFGFGEVVKSVAVSPSGCLLLALVRIAHGLHLRIVRHGCFFTVVDEVRLSKLIPCLRLGPHYTETGHCAWSWDGRRVGFAASTGHCGVLVRRRGGPAAAAAQSSAASIESCDSFTLGDSRLQLEWLRKPSLEPSAVAASPPRAFAFWPADPAVVEVEVDEDDTNEEEDKEEDAEGVDVDSDDGQGAAKPRGVCRCLLVVGGVRGSGGGGGGFFDVVGGFEAAAGGSGPLKYRRLLRVPLPSAPATTPNSDAAVADIAEVLQFSGSGRLLAVGCRSGRVLVYSFRGLLIDRQRRPRLALLPTDGGVGVSIGAVTSVAVADSEEVLAAGDTCGRVRLWRLGPADADADASDEVVGSLAWLCRRAVAAHCDVNGASRLPLPRALLPELCVSRRAQQRPRSHRGLRLLSFTTADRLNDGDDDCDCDGDDDGDGRGSVRTSFSISFFG